MSFNESIEIELRSLANECKKKSELKNLTEQAISLLRQSEKPPADLIFQVLNTAKSTNTKATSLTLSILQKLLMSDCLESLHPALFYLKSMLDDSSDESTQLKVLQSFMLILDPNRARICPDLTNTIWEVYVLLQGSKSGLIRSTAYAALRHLASLIFDGLKGDKSEEVIASGVIVFSNSCEVVKSRTYELIKIKGEILNLLLDICERSKPYISSIPRIYKILFTDLYFYLQTQLVEDFEENTTGKLIKISLIVCEVTKSSSDLIRSVLALLDNRKNPEWLTVASLEFLNSLFSSTDLLKFVYSETEIHSRVLDSLSKVSHEMFAQSEDLRQAGTKTKVKIISELISHWVDSISLISDECGIKLGETNTQVSSSLPYNLVSSIWRPLLPILSIIVSNVYNESVLQSLLNSYQTLVNLAGTLSLPLAREALLASLCQFCIPVTGTLTHKNLQICKTLFNITHCLGFVLDSKAWHKVLDTLYKLDYLLNNVQKYDDQDLASDVSILNSAMDSLFKNTHIWPDSTITDLMSALGQLTLEFMETLSTNDKKISNGKLFGLEKMIIVAQNNLERVELYWDSLIAYLDCISNYKYPEIRALGNNSISRIMLSAFKRFLDNPPGTAPKWKAWQRTLLLVLHDLHGSSYLDTQDYVYSVLYNILQANGGKLDEGGWAMLLFILSKINVSGQGSGKEGFKCLQLIVNDFLQSESLFASLERLIACVSKYAHSEDSTQAIGAVGMYWNIADFLGKIGNDKLDLWWIILEELKILGEDPRVEVRHSALHSLHITLSTHGSLFTPSNWQRVMQDVVLGVFDRISLNYLKVCKKTGLGKTGADNTEKQWEETYNIFTQNLGRIFITYLQNLKKLEKEVLDEPLVGKNWETLITRLKEGIDSGTLSIITAVLKTVRELLLCPQVNSLFFSKWSSSWMMLEGIDSRFKESNVSIQYKIITVLLEVLSLIYMNKFDDPFEEKPLATMLSIISSLLKATSAEGTLTLGKLLPEQREVWEYIEKILETLITQNRDLEVFIKFLVGYLKISTDEPHSDSFCRKSLEITEKIFLQNFEKCKMFTLVFLNALHILTVLRYSNEDFLNVFNAGKGAQPIWIVAEDCFIKIIGQVLIPDFTEKIILILTDILNPPEKTVSKLSKPNLDLLCKSAEEVDTQLVNTLTSILSTKPVANQATLSQLLTVIDLGCDSFYKAVHTQELNLQKAFNNSCFSSLLFLSSPSSVCSSNATHVLVNRCKEIISRFSKEEKLSGQMPLPRIKLLEMLDILHSIKKHEVPEGVLKKPGKKGHLLELFPQLCELITAKDPDVKEALKEIFLEVSLNL